MAESLDVIELLIQDHRVMGKLLQQLDEAEQPEELRLIYFRLVELLSGHEAAEQQVVFPALRSALPATGQETANRLAEHEEVNELMAEMRGLTPQGPGFEKRASALMLELQNHFSNEEESVFPQLQAALSHDELVELAERVEAVKRRAPAFPEPERAPIVHRPAVS
jgi:hemerythrin superfamily protein